MAGTEDRPLAALASLRSKLRKAMEPSALARCGASAKYIPPARPSRAEAKARGSSPATPGSPARRVSAAQIASLEKPYPLRRTHSASRSRVVGMKMSPVSMTGRAAAACASSAVNGGRTRWYQSHARRSASRAIAAFISSTDRAGPSCRIDPNSGFMLDAAIVSTGSNNVCVSGGNIWKP